MAKTNEWDADPERYARLATPLDSPRHARATAKAFMGELAKLREKHHIPELLVQFIVYCKPEEGEGETLTHETLSLQGGGGWGNQAKQLRLAKLSLDRELESLTAMLQTLAETGVIAVAQLITEPVKPEDQP